MILALIRFCLATANNNVELVTKSVKSVTEVGKFNVILAEQACSNLCQACSNLCLDNTPAAQERPWQELTSLISVSHQHTSTNFTV